MRERGDDLQFSRNRIVSKEERIEKDLRDLWDDYATIMESVLDSANQIERSGEITERNKRAISSLAFEFSQIVDKLEEIVFSLQKSDVGSGGGGGEIQNISRGIRGAFNE